MNETKAVVPARARPTGSPMGPGRRRTTAPREPRLVTPSGASYPVAEFLDDQRRILEALGGISTREPESHRAIDGGRLVSVAVNDLNQIPSEARREVTGLFRRKYGSASGAGRRARFFRVVQFVTQHSSEIEHNGFGRFDWTTEVHEELLRYLLNFPVAPRSDTIPSSALTRFYDDWGLRWF